MSPELQIIGWLSVVAVAIWATVAFYVFAIWAMVGWTSKLMSIPFGVIATVFWWLAWTSAPFSIIWGAA